MSETDPGFLAALEEGKKGAAEGGVPIGACLVSKDGKILGQGHNMRVQDGSAILHVSTSTNPMVLLRLYHVLTPSRPKCPLSKTQADCPP
jgi:tRNA(Arg) A34 adenosine deaminase TadA